MTRFWLLTLVLSCAGTPAQGPTPRSPPPAAKASSGAAPPKQAAPAQSVADPDAESGDSEPEPADSTPPDEPHQPRGRELVYPREQAIDVKEWAQTHDVALKGIPWACRAAERQDMPASRARVERDPWCQCWDLEHGVGVPLAPGVLCEEYVRRPPQTVARLYRKDARSLKMVWKGVVGTWANWIELTPLVAPDGASLQLRDESNCGLAIAQAQEKLEYGVHDGDFVHAVASACHQVGTYHWQKNGYVLDPATRVQGSPGERGW